jgi:hypothetical protein
MHALKVGLALSDPVDSPVFLQTVCESIDRTYVDGLGFGVGLWVIFPRGAW